jgi:hypothetical protein
MANSLATLIEKNEDKLVDQSATSLKMMFGIAYTGVPQEELIERLQKLFDSFAEIARQGSAKSAQTQIIEIVESVLVEPLYQGWDYRAITEEVLRVVDMAVNNLIDNKLAKPEQAEDKTESKELLAEVIRTAKEVVNGRARRAAAAKLAKTKSTATANS